MRVQLLPDNKSIYADGVILKLRSIKRYKHPAPHGNTCFNCIAHHNMDLCDAICMHCKLGYVFGRDKDAQ